MEEAIVDVALDPNLLPSEASLPVEVQEDRCTDKQDQAQLLAHVQNSSLASHRWPQDRAARVEALRLSLANGTYQPDSAELAECIVRNSTRFLETSLAIAETS
jgi:anti-sigma28 factor (negative regulator of flagellin synthesis)